MPKFRKKSIEIEARQYDGTSESASNIIGWLRTNGETRAGLLPHYVLVIPTDHGDATAEPGDWVIKGVSDFYPCKAATFAEIYEPA